MMSLIISLGVVLVLAILYMVFRIGNLVGLVKGKKDESKETVEMAATAKVTIEQAIKTASEKVAGKVVEAELEMKHDKLVWEVEVVTAENKVMEVHIDADSGAVIDVEEEKPENDMKSEQKQKGKQQHKP